MINQLRAILLERGIVAPQGKRKLKHFLVNLMDEHGKPGLSPRMITLVTDVRAQWAELDRRIAAFDAEFVRWTKRMRTPVGWRRSQGSARQSPRHDRGNWRRPRPQSTAAVYGHILGLVSTQVHDRRKDEAAGHQQARQQVSTRSS